MSSSGGAAVTSPVASVTSEDLAAERAAEQANAGGGAPVASPPCPRAQVTVDPSRGGFLPLAAQPDAGTLPLASIPSAGASSNVPSIHGVNIGSYIQFKVDLGAVNFNRWRKVINFLLARHHAQDHVQKGLAGHLDDPD